MDPAQVTAPNDPPVKGFQKLINVLLTSKFVQKYNSFSPDSKVLAILIVVVLLSTLATASYIQKAKLSGRIEIESQRTEAAKGWQSHDESTKNGKLNPPQKIIEVNLTFNSKKNPVLSLSKLNIKKAYPKKPVSLSGSYTAELFDKDDSTIHSIDFNIPNQLAPLPPISKEKSPNPGQTLEKADFTVNLPLMEDAEGVRIIDPDNNEVAKEPIKHAQDLNNKPDFKSIKGSDVKSREGYNKLLKEIEAATTDTTFVDITFIGDDYVTAADLDKFRTDANNFINNLLTYEPFKSRTSQLYFHLVDNTNDLGCYISGDRLLICNTATVTQTVNNYGAPFDRIYVIYNQNTYSGGAYYGGDISQGYNGSWGPQVFVHEFGHSLALLVDEYLAQFSGARTDRNCYTGTPPNTLWTDLVPATSYYPECNFSNAYRSSLNSIMRAIDSYQFNPVSQKYISEAVDLYAGHPTGPTPTPTVIPSPTPEPTAIPTVIETVTPVPTTLPEPSPTPTIIDNEYPDVVITSPQNESFVDGDILFHANATDDTGITQVKFSLDSVNVLAVDTTAPYETVWNAALAPEGRRLLYAHAYDSTNKIKGVGVFVNIDRTAPFVSVTYPTNLSTVRNKSKVTLKAQATDSAGIAKVEFYVNNSLVCSDTASGYSCVWRVPSGKGITYKISAKAYDFAGLTNINEVTIVSK